MKKLVLISGISGAGKTTASNIMEDMGYTCIDQYPVELLQDLIELIRNDNSYKYDKVALTISLVDLDNYYNLLANSELQPLIILLTADRDTIISRYKFTRRVHPLVTTNIASTLVEAVGMEFKLLTKYEKYYSSLVDTTKLSPRQLKNRFDKILGYDDYNNLTITFASFGFKNGVPDDADMIFDVRMLPNPYYIPELKELTGNDKPVQDYVMSFDQSKEYIRQLTAYLDFVIAAYDDEEKRHLSIYIGCTGGQHRSVTIANYLHDHYKEKYLCYINHREMK